MIKKTNSLSLYPKFLIGLMYVYLLSNLLLILIKIIDPTYLSTPTLADGIFFIVTTLVLAGLTGYTIYSLHKRKKIALVLVVLTIFLSYGFNSFPLGAYSEESSVLSSFLFSTIFLAVDTLAITYVMLSKEMKKQFNKD